MLNSTVKKDSNKKNKVLRIITGWTIALIAIVMIVMGSIPLYIASLVVVALCSKEFVKILRYKGFHPSLTVIMISGIIFSTLIFFHRFDMVHSILTLTITTSFLVVLFMGRQPYIVNVATTILGALYCGLLPSHMLLIRQINTDKINIFGYQLQEGLCLLMFVFVAVALTDVFAYYFGTKFGKHKLAEVISPKKTIEGAVGGGICAVLASCLGVFYTNLTIIQAIVGGILVTLSAQLGDLSESLIKRDAGVKDSSDILPGHGGMLDRFDGYIFALPVAYYYFIHFTQGQNVLLECISYLKGLINVYF